MNTTFKRVVLTAAILAVLATVLVPAGLALAQQSVNFQLGCFSMTAGATQRSSANFRMQDLTSWVGAVGNGANSTNFRIRPGAIQWTASTSAPPGPGGVRPTPNPTMPEGNFLPVIFKQILVLRYDCN